MSNVGFVFLYGKFGKIFLVVFFYFYECFDLCRKGVFFARFASIFAFFLGGEFPFFSSYRYRCFFFSFYIKLGS